MRGDHERVKSAFSEIMPLRHDIFINVAAAALERCAQSARLSVSDEIREN